MESTVSERVKEVMKYFNFDPETDQARFSREIGMERPDNLYNVINGKTQNATKVFELITKRYENVNPAYLFWDRKPMILPPFKVESESIVPEGKVKEAQMEPGDIDDVWQLKQLLGNYLELQNQHKLLQFQYDVLKKENDSLKGEIKKPG